MSDTTAFPPTDPPAPAPTPAPPAAPAPDATLSDPERERLFAAMVDFARSANQVPPGFEVLNYWVRRIENYVYFAVGFATLIYLSKATGGNPAVTFLLAIIAVALVLYATGTQSTGIISSGWLRAAVGGGAALLALGAGYLVSQQEDTVRSLFRVTAIPYIIEVEYCLKLDQSCTRDESVFNEEDRFTADSEANVVAVGDGGERTFGLNGEGATTLGLQRHLVFTKETIALQMKKKGLYNVYNKAMTLRQIEAARNSADQCIDPEGGCLVRVMSARHDGNVERVYRLLVAFHDGRVDRTAGGVTSVTVTKSRDFGAGAVETSVDLH